MNYSPRLLVIGGGYIGLELDRLARLAVKLKSLYGAMFLIEESGSGRNSGNAF